MHHLVFAERSYPRRALVERWSSRTHRVYRLHCSSHLVAASFFLRLPWLLLHSGFFTYFFCLSFSCALAPPLSLCALAVTLHHTTHGSRRCLHLSFLNKHALAAFSCTLVCACRGVHRLPCACRFFEIDTSTYPYAQLVDDLRHSRRDAFLRLLLLPTCRLNTPTQAAS